jgi:hypothetical protein
MMWRRLVPPPPKFELAVPVSFSERRRWRVRRSIASVRTRSQ